MWKCSECDRHVLPVVQVCPFCTTLRVAKLGTAVVTPIVLSACYGAPPCGPDELIDVDNDGFFEPLGFCDWYDIDCDDSDPAVNPGAEEICDDGIDNDCDGWEAESTNEESCNGLDDDCDGEIDEDGACDPPDTGTDTGTDPSTASAMSVTLTWSSPAPVGTCAEAGVATLDIRLRPQLDQDPVLTENVPCEDADFTVNVQAEGAWLVDAVATSEDGIRNWASPPIVVDLGPDTTAPVSLELTCSSDTEDGCGTAP